MQTIIKFHQQDFVSDDSNTVAYQDACKWVAMHIVKHEVEIGEVLWRVTKVAKASLPTFRLELFAYMDADETSKRFCDKCKEFHKAFYINDDKDCARCNYTAFKKQTNERLLVKKEYKREKLRRLVKINRED